ncbi:hypothetical protein AUR64_10055 [Haloprofundus marisrubri]|uniref:Halobacterial output domain-containing protein n=1 Tax=Haloprofundus marisrubri TaxID=1514971 RepID=A0A0W1R960_9EURY|nr:HalOD1 output domain-containing protein [Haloprofundus marisrubri]KTG09949.1 hypothetical protein AUR64_10055 [Haloprofundus marisrubri]
MSDETSDTATHDADARLVTSVSLGEFDTATEAVVSTVATLENTTPRGLPPLRSYVDADALDNILQTPRQSRPSNVKVGFVYLDYEIVVTGGETVAIFEREEGRVETSANGTTDSHADEYVTSSRADVSDEFE